MSQNNFIFEGTADNFNQLVVKNSHKGLVVVDFWAPWAGPSMKQRGLLCDLAERFKGRFLLVSINTDDQKPIAQQYGVRSLPSLKIFRNGEVAAEYHGVQPEADYLKIIEKYLAAPPDETRSQAIAAWQDGHPDQALQILANAAVATPHDLSLPALMAKILIRQQRLQEALELLNALPDEALEDNEINRLLTHIDFSMTAADAGIGSELESQLQENPDDSDTRYQLAAVLILQDQQEAALDHLLHIAKHDPQFKDGLARKRIQGVLSMLDADTKTVVRYRRELFNLNH